jgi:H+-translocating NAD(P) transhydrogenase subunit alpha
VISTALIPGRAAPELITPEMVASMKPGSVIVDLAAGRGAVGPHGEAGGNCVLTQADKVVNVNGVKLVGYTNLAAMVGADASALYARNVLDFLKLVLDKDKGFHVDMDDDIVAACLMTRDGQVLRA